MQIEINKQLILENIKIKDLDLTNQEEVEEYGKIYSKQFKTKFEKKLLKKWKNDNLKITKDNNKVVGIMRYKKPTQKKITWLSDLASIKKGSGKKMINHLKKNSSGPIMLIPWKDSLIPYYEKFGFRTEYPKDKSKPSVIQIWDK